MRLPGRVRPADENAESYPMGSMLADPRRSMAWAALLLGLAAVVFLLIWNTTTRAWIQDIDDAWLRLMEDLRWQPLVSVAELLSFLGGTYCTWVIRATVIVILIVRKHWLSLAAFLLAVVISEAFIGPMKALYDRPRPIHHLVAVSGQSFPSGHAVAASVTAVGLVIALFPPGHKRWVWERQAALYASIMALSRTYLGAHWLSDVIAGALLGSGIALACPAVLVDLRVRYRAKHPEVAREQAD